MLDLLGAVKNNDKEKLQLILDGNQIDTNTRFGKTNYTVLHEAARNGNYSICEMLIKHGASLNALNDENNSPLHLAIANGNMDVYKLLIHCGANVYTRGEQNMTNLHIATENGHLNLCKALIEMHRFDVHLKDVSGLTPLHYCCKNGNYNLFQFLKDVGSNTYLNTKTGQNCLHIAAKHGHFELCKILLNNYNFNVHDSDNEGYTPLICSAESGNYEIFWYFIKMGGDPKAKNKRGETCVHGAAKNGHMRFCKLVLDNFELKIQTTDNQGYTCLHHSARSGNSELVKYFINTEGNIYLKTNDGKNCLHLAAEGGHINLCKIFLQEYIFDLHITDRYGKIPLHYCAENGSYELFTYLVQSGSDVYLKTNEGKSCLHLAADGGHIDICRILLEKYTFDIHQKDQFGKSPLHYSATNGSFAVFKYFVKMKSDVYQKTKNGKNCLLLAVKGGCVNLCNTLLEVYNLDLNVVDHTGKNSLHCGAKYGKYELFENFIKMGSNVYQKANDGKNCLILASQGGHFDICKRLIEIYNFDIDIVDCYGKGPLHYSAEDGSYELFQYFAEVGCKIYKKTKNGENCLILAAQKGHVDLCKRLVRKYSFDINIVDRSGQSSLHSSARNGNYQLFQFFLSMGSNINQRTNSGGNCLLLAAQSGCMDLCKTLIEKYNFDIHATDNSGKNSLHYCAESGNYKLFQYFIDMGININQKTNNGKNCLILAAEKGYADLCKALVTKYSFDIHIVDFSGQSSLHSSAINGDYQLFQYFLSMGSDINQRTNSGKNCLLLAAEAGCIELSKTLVEKYDFDIYKTDNSGKSVFHFTAENGNFELFQYFINMGSDINKKTNYGNSDLHFCARHGNQQLFRYLIDLGSNINQITKNGQNCLMLAAKRGYVDFCKTLIEKYCFDIHITDYFGKSALHYCAENGNHQLFYCFLDIGSDINQKTNNGQNCLHIAAEKGYKDLCKTFIEEYNLEINITDNYGTSALLCCARNGNYQLFQYFIKMGSNINQRTKYDQNCLHRAASGGYMDLCKILVEKYNFDIHVTDYFGKSALHYCVENGNHQLFHYLLDMGSDINQRTNNGQSCLHIAAARGYKDLCKEFIEECNFDINITDNHGASALLCCAACGNYQLFQYFIKMGSNINQRTKYDQNCLHRAASGGYMDLCKILVEKYNFDIHVTDYFGKSALHYCAGNGNLQLFHYFLDMGSDINQRTRNGKNCLHIVVQGGYMDLCKILVEKYNFDIHVTDYFGKSALHYCVENGNHQLFHYLLDMGSDINQRTNNGQSCLHIAAARGYKDLCKEFIEECNFDINITDNHGASALLCCAAWGNYQLFQYFIKMGSNINQRNKYDQNCLHRAASGGYMDLCKILVEKYNFDIHVTDYFGKSALHYCVENGNHRLFHYLLDMGSDINQRTRNGENCLHIVVQGGYMEFCKLLIEEYSFDINITDYSGRSALLCCSANGNHQLFHYLISMGSDINQRTNNGQSCLHIAAARGYKDLCKEFIEECNFDINITDNHGASALLCCAAWGNYQLFQYFIKMGSNINQRNKYDQNCLHLAARTGYVDLCKILVEKYNFDIHVTDYYGKSALHYCAGNGNYQLFQYFLKTGIDINLRTKHHENCLHIAAYYGHIELCKMLIEKYSFDIHAVDRYGRSPLHKCCDFFRINDELFQYLITMGSDIYQETSNGENILHLAAKGGNMSFCKTLIQKYNFDIHRLDNSGNSLLHHCARNSYYEMFQYFVKLGSDINHRANDGENCLLSAAKRGRFGLCKTFIENHNFDVHTVDYQGQSSLHFSARNGHHQLFQYLFQMGADIYQKTKNGSNCLLLAAQEGYGDLCKTLIEEYNFDVNVVNNNGKNPLHYCAENFNYVLFQYFLKLGNDIYQKTKHGQNCLHIASRNGDEKLCKFLVESYNFDPQMSDYNDKIPLHYCVERGHFTLFKYFLKIGSDIHLKTKLGENCLHLAAKGGYMDLCKWLVKRYNFSVNERDMSGATPLHYCVSSGHFELFTYFIEVGSDSNLETNSGQNCLHFAARYGDERLCKTLVETHNLDINMSDYNGKTPLHYCAQSGSYELFQYFVKLGCDTHLKTNEGENCLHFAAKSGNLTFCKKLFEDYNFSICAEDKLGKNPLHYCIKHDNLFHFFIKMESDIYLKTKNDESLLHLAAWNGRLHLCKKILGSYKFSVDIIDNSGKSPLHNSVENGHFELFQYFLEMGSNVYLKTKENQNCLHFAALGGHTELCETLIENYGFDVNITDNSGKSALHYCAESGSGELFNYLVKMESEVFLKATDGQNCLHFAALKGQLDLCMSLLESYAFQVHVVDNQDFTPLHCCAKSGNFKLFMYLLDKGSGIYSKTKTKVNVLHIAAEHGHIQICEYVLDHFKKGFKNYNRIKQYPLNETFYTSQIFYKYRNIFLHALDAHGSSYLHCAVAGNHPDICRLLLEHDIDVTLLNEKEESARDLAKSKGYKNVLNVLKDKYDRIGNYFFELYICFKTADFQLAFATARETLSQSF